MIWLSSACETGLHVAARLAENVGVRLCTPRSRIADTRGAIISLIGRDPGRQLQLEPDDIPPDWAGVDQIWELLQPRDSEKLRQQALQAGISYQRFALDPVAERPDTILAGAFSRFMQVLDRTVQEVRCRDAEYFERHALRTTLPADFALLDAANAAAEVITAAAVSPQRCRVSARAPSPLSDAIADAYELELILGAEASALSAVDRLFESRLDDIKPHSAGTMEEPVLMVDPISAAELAALIAQWCKHHAASRLAERERLARTPPAVTTGHGPASVRIFGVKGPFIVIVNAIAQDARYWIRLIDRLACRHRVLIWTPPAVDEAGRPAGFVEQARAFDSVVAEVTDEPVNLVGWCTGPKLCAHYYLTQPQRVRSMVFLAGTYRPFGDSTLDTTYETTLEMVFRLLERSPAMVPTVRNTLLDAVNAGRSNVARVGDAGAEVLARLDPELIPSVTAPYTSDEATLRYAWQIRDFWCHSIEHELGAIRAPVLVLGAELDWIASSRLGLRVAQALPNARFVELPGATHWCMHDRPDDVSTLIAHFVDE
jgi:pimeloyl-ACP methyl ester carboxylesterase